MGKLGRSEQSLINTQVLYADSVDLTIYVEDKDESGIYEKFYEILLTQIFSEQRIRIVHAGGRSRVIEMHSIHIKSPMGNALFIIDGDFNILHSSDIRMPMGLFQLKKYCIENYLIQEKAIIEVLYRNNSSQSRNKISTLLGFKDWEKKICTSTQKLIILYAICDKAKPKGIKTAKRPLDEYSPSKDGELSDKNISAIMASIEKTLSNYPNKQIAPLNKKIRSSIKNGRLTPMDTLSGKTILLPLIFARACNRVKHTCSDQDVFSQQLVERCDLSDLYTMKEAVFHIS